MAYTVQYNFYKIEYKAVSPQKVNIYLIVK